ncbi:MAG: type I-B CRISPR-associated endonuclease Cas1b [Ignavibacteriaceae bacterium]|jgi:CRISPR-associated protein Cas1|nr:type I-B CRISPR-associated endonuclease Cas1b [Ignavibacteriaceae bacterium]
MKNNIYIFSNTVLSRKDNSLMLQTEIDSEALNKVDIYESTEENVLLPVSKSETSGKPKYIPAESVESIYTFGEVRFNTQLFKCLSNYAIPVHIFNYYGSYVGSFIPENKSGSGDIQLLQYSAYLNQYRRIYIAKAIIQTSLKNILTSLKAYTYTGLDLDEQINTISANLEQVRFAASVQELMGFEGQVRNTYYESWQKILKQQNDFYKRIKNPPAGTINSLISFGNSLLYAVCFSEIYRTRLSPFIGFIHEVGDNKHPLVYDISEIFKPVIVDKVIFRVINLNIIQPDDFKQTAKGLYLKDEARKKFVEEFEKRLSTVILHKRINRRLSFRSLIRMECYNLINYLNGKNKSYDPYRAN